MTPSTWPVRPTTRALWLWGPVLVHMALIFGASSLSEVGPLPGEVSDKTAHFLAYALLGILALRALTDARLAGISWRTGLLAIAIATGYGIADEIHQRFVPGRSPDVLDVAADGLGALGGVALGGALRLAVGIRPKHPTDPSV